MPSDREVDELVGRLTSELEGVVGRLDAAESRVAALEAELDHERNRPLVRAALSRVKTRLARRVGHD